MALTRARVIAGDAGLARDIEAAIAATLCAKRDRAALAKDVREMRALIGKEKGDADPWDLKLVSGGLLDIEFIAQFLVLASAHKQPGIRDVSTRAVLVKAGAAGLLTPAQAEALTNAHRLFTDTTQIMRLSVDGPFDPALAAGGVQSAASPPPPRCPILRPLAGAIAEAREKVREVFRAALGVGRRR